MGSVLVPGQVFAGYRIERLLGAGGMGEVFLARDRGLPRFVALKVLARAVGENEDVRRRFQREADTVARLSHPNIVTIYTRGEEEGLLWISMAYVDGLDLAAALSAGALTIERTVRIAGAAADALDHAHDTGVLHRDVKPANILLTGGASERVLLTDFGIAKGLGDSVVLTRTNEVYASFQYTAPERLDFGAEVDRRADVYSLGCTVYHMLTGEIPYPGTSAAHLIHGHLYRPVPKPSERNPAVPPAFDAVVARALAKNPDDRFPDCGRLAEAVAAAATGSRPTVIGGAPPRPVELSQTRPTGGYGGLARPVAEAGTVAADGAGRHTVGDAADAGIRSARRGRTVAAIVGGLVVLVAAAAAIFGLVRSADGDEPEPTRAMGTDPALVGTWQGVAEQDDQGTVSRYRMTITLRPGAVGTVGGSTTYEVQGGNCSGELTLRQSGSDGMSASFFERIVSGPCIPNGNVTVSAAGVDRLDFSYSGVTREGKAQRVTAALDRVG